MAENAQFIEIDFRHFKAFRSFQFKIKNFNILVGPNNAGKSTIIAAFRILAASLRKAGARKAKIVQGPFGAVNGYEVDLSAISIAEENLFFNYDDSEPAIIKFDLSNGNSLTLFFPEQGVCNLIPDAQGRSFSNPTAFRKHFPCPIGFVPILGPVDHRESLYEKEAARLALFNYRAARNFRNIWYWYPDKFEEFRSILQQTWPGMDIERPEIDRSYDKPVLHMYCPEKRIPRELFWSGFGFQVWCQMLTHVIQSRDVSLFLIDEPDIYLHSELQRQLLGILRNLGPDIILATHSTEIITEAESDEIVLINKEKNHAKRIKNPDQLGDVFSSLGSNINPILTQLAKTRKVIFVKGKDFQILGKFARKLGENGVGNRRDFAVVAVEGFNPERARNLKAGMEATLGSKVSAAVILDRDYRSETERKEIEQACLEFCDFVRIHGSKEIENFLLVPNAIDRALARKAAEQSKRSRKKIEYEPFVEGELNDFIDQKKNYVLSQYLSERRRFERERGSAAHDASINEAVLNEVDPLLREIQSSIKVIPGKEALHRINLVAQNKFGINATFNTIIDAMLDGEVPQDMRSLIRDIADFAT